MKFQTPTIGGVRKVINTGKTQSQDLAALVTQLNALTTLVNQFIANQNTGGGNISQGDEAVLVPGPGLSGGGPMVGKVPINLIAPGAMLWAEDGQDGERGPQGVQGLQGNPGSPGTPQLMADIDSVGDDDRFLAPNSTTVGPLAVTGLLSIGSGLAQYTPLMSVIYVPGSNGNGNSIEFGHANIAGFRSIIGNESGSGKSFIAFNAGAGTNSNSFRTFGNSGSVIEGDLVGGFTFSTVPTASADNQSLTLRAVITSQGSIGVTGATPAVTANQTDIGTTTTTTVITTAGGIALPALASTFGVINWKGVQYGLPLFAL